MVVLALVGAGLAGALPVGLAVSRWPRAEPASPAVSARVAREVVGEHPTTRTFLQARRDPAVVTGLALTIAVAITVIGGVAVGILFWMVRASAGVARADHGVATWGASHASDAATTVLQAATELGATVTVVVVAVLVVGIDVARSRRFTALPFVLIVVLGQNALANGIKVIVERARPDIDQLVHAAGTSFPSGHSTAAAASYFAFALVLGRSLKPEARPFLAGAAAGIATMVAASRVLLGVHWLTDVLAGLALGWAWFAVCAIAFGGRLLRFGAPVEAAERAVTVSNS